MEKFKKYWVPVLELITVVVAIVGMFSSYETPLGLEDIRCSWSLASCDFNLELVLVYFLSTGLVLFLLRKYE
jgi:hypothetical protein